MQVAEPEILGIVDDDRIRVGDIDPRLNNGRRNQYVELTVDKIHHQFSEFAGIHLAVSHCHTSLWTQLPDQSLDLSDRLHAIVDKIDLTVTGQLILDRLADDVLIEKMALRSNRLTVGRRRGNHRQVARAHQRELERTRYRGGRQRQRIDVRFDLPQLLLGRDAELLLLIDNQQPEIFEYDILAENFMRPDQDVDLTCCRRLKDGPSLLGTFDPTQVLDPHRKILQSIIKGPVMLQGQNRRRDQYGHLLGIGHRLECRTNRHLRLAEAHIAADQPIHRRSTLHVLFDKLRRRLLIGCILINERRLQLVLQIAVR